MTFRKELSIIRFQHNNLDQHDGCDEYCVDDFCLSETRQVWVPGQSNRMYLPQNSPAGFFAAERRGGLVLEKGAILHSVLIG